MSTGVLTLKETALPILASKVFTLVFIEEIFFLRRRNAPGVSIVVRSVLHRPHAMKQATGDV